MIRWDVDVCEDVCVCECVIVIVLRVKNVIKINKSPERRLNLSRSWHKGHSHAYNTSFFI